MLRYKTETRPGLVALYDIWPGNGAGPFLQPGTRTGHQRGSCHDRHYVPFSLSSLSYYVIYCIYFPSVI